MQNFKCENWSYLSCDKVFKTAGTLITHVAKAHGWCLKHQEAYGIELDADCNYIRNCGCLEYDENLNVRKVRNA